MADSQITDNGPNRTQALEKAQFNAADIFAQAAPSMVRFTKYWGPIPMGRGSGFFVSSDKPHSCEIATGKHVADEDIAYVTTRDGKTYHAKPELLDAVHEISIYKLDGVESPEETCRELQVNSGEATAGEPVIAIGAAGDRTFGLFGASAEHPKFHAGTITGNITKKAETATGYEWLTKLLYGYPNPQSMYSPMLVSTYISSIGYSGGPWLDAAGKVIGINWGGNNATSRAELSRFLQEDLDRIKAERGTTNTVSGKPIRIE